MSNFLTLCQRVREDCGVQGSGPASVLNQTGMYAKIVKWTARAWVDIQAARPYWKFLRNQYVGPLVIGTRTYSIKNDLLLTTVDKFDPMGAMLYKTSVADQVPLTWRSYPEFRSMYTSGFTAGRPTALTEQQADTIAFNRTPDYAYTLTLDYWMTPELLVNNSDVPAAPEQYHDIISWKAVMMFAAVEGATELLAFAKNQYDKMFTQLVLDQTDAPTKRKDYPIATGRTTVSGSELWTDPA
jgi:hypothetical protein